jgi:hypothetical protein
MGRIVSGTLLTLLTFAALGPPMGAITLMLDIVLIPDPSRSLFGSRPILDVFAHILFITTVSMLFSYVYVKAALFCGLVASVVRLVVLRADLQIGLTTLAGVVTGIYQTVVNTTEPPRAHLPSEYLLMIAICAVPAPTCAWISRPRLPSALPLAAPVVPDARLPS